MVFEMQPEIGRKLQIFYTASLYFKPRLHLIHVARVQVVSICIACRRLHVSCFGDKIVVNAALRRHVSTCIRIQVARQG